MLLLKVEVLLSERSRFFMQILSILCRIILPTVTVVMTKRGDKTPKAMGYFMGGEIFKNQLHVWYIMSLQTVLK